MKDTKWPKAITVDKKIILLLSASTYENFPRALRELVSNAYDADATKLEIKILQGEQIIEVVDNGSGMTPEEFEFYLRIAGSNEERSRTTPMGRKRVGQFGIGFLAMFPFCETVEIESTIEGSPIIFKATLPASKYLSSKNRDIDISEIHVEGIEFVNEKKREEHYTKFRLLKTTGLLSKYLDFKLDTKSSRHSIRSYDGMKRLTWELQDVLPIHLKSSSPVSQYIDTKPRNFTVYLNGKKLLGNCEVEEVLEHSDGLEKVGNIEFTYAIGTAWKSIVPDEARGLRIRLNHVGVGKREIFDLGTAGRTFSRLHWLSGEVNIVSGLDESITLDRDSFTASQDYYDFREFFRSKLREVAFYIEDVDVAQRKIKAQLSNSPRSETASQYEVLTKQISTLRKRGFTVIAGVSSSKTPIKVDTKSKTVEISGNLEDLKDQIIVDNRTWDITYSSWDPQKTKYRACFISDDGSIHLNKNYTLFQSANKDTFRKIQIILTLAEFETVSKDDFYNRIQQLLISEFG